ncbi:hybrid sensor histidine kinase/response regulator [Desulfovibrio psychrotolerans]|uniref:histidine kinase n=1 Tax=Desulfovibrio psychrotolerans TaxID=415242 RepID=A0A7J0BNK6_9BACT|nr:response regulator [Desulfovibrio psychrotolerans]GFM35317.1 hypothetical protein DSM19430T_00010 [Desulfovibrio psychrotolerans]
MLNKSNQGHAFAFACDGQGGNCTLVLDKKGYFSDRESAFSTMSMPDDLARKQFGKLLLEAAESGFSLCDQVMLPRENGRCERFSLFGIKRIDHVFVIAVQSPQHIFPLYEDLMKMINEQSQMLRETQRRSVTEPQAARSPDRNIDFLQELMELNNELANMQRQIAKKNSLLQEQEKRFRSLATATPDPQIVLAADNTFLFLNPAAEAILARRNEDSVGIPCLLDFNSSPELCFSSSGNHICVEVRSTEIQWNNQPARLISLRDITERKQVEQMKEDVQRIAQHDLISPLNPIVNIPELLQKDNNLTREQKNMLRTISRAGVRMLHMIRLSLDLHKMETGRFEFSPEPVDLLETFHDILADQSQNMLSRQVEVALHVDNRHACVDEKLYVSAQPMLCYSLFSNLVLNSMEASQPGDTVLISLHSGNDGRVRTDIHNNGAVPHAVRARFFDKYATAGKTHGTGLGTYSARLIANTLHGNIAMHTSETAGTTVTVHLPAARQADMPEPLSSPIPDQLWHCATILIADDEPVNRLITKRLLEKSGFRVLLAEDGEQALQRLRQHPCDAVLMDVQMPKLDGIQATKAIRHGEAGKHHAAIPVIALTAFMHKEELAPCMEAGMTTVVRKPLDMDELLTVLRNLL